MKLNLSVKNAVVAGAVFAASGVLIAGCDFSDSSNAAAPAQQHNANITNQIENAATQAVPYPLTQMEQGGWTEEKMLREHLLRENDPNAVRYVAWMTQTGQLVAQWTIKGMVFDPNSSMTETTDTNCDNGGQSPSCATVNSPGDNGTYGPEAFCYAFFTTSNVEVQLPCSAIAVESDAPLNLTDKPIITYNVNDTPSVNHGGLVGIGGH